MARDNWEHRSENMLCVTCMYFVVKIGALIDKSAPEKILAVGRCRRYAPTMKGFPVVFESDWCGDHKIDENKL